VEGTVKARAPGAGSFIVISCSHLVLLVRHAEHAGGEGSRSEGHRRGVPALARKVLPMSSAIACRRSQAPVASDPMLPMVAHRSRLLAAISTSPAATLTLEAGLCLGRVPQLAPRPASCRPLRRCRYDRPAMFEISERARRAARSSRGDARR
jgi:hypothetical protein